MIRALRHSRENGRASRRIVLVGGRFSLPAALGYGRRYGEQYGVV